MSNTNERAVTLPISGTINWAVNPIYPGVTPVSIQHYTEIESYTVAVHDALDWHRAERSYKAHPSVNLDKPGFLPPELVKNIYGIQDKINELYDLLSKRMPEGIIHMYDGDLSNLPSKYVLCDGSNRTPNLVGNFGLGGSTANTYKLHQEVNSNITDITSLFTESNLPKHAHTYQNTWYSENSTSAGDGYETKFGRTYGSDDSDWDNSLAYVDDYTEYTGTTVSSTSVANLQPKYIKAPFIMRKFSDVSCTVTVVQPANGTIKLDGANRTTYTVPKGTIVVLAQNFPADYELDLLSIGSDVYNTMPYAICVTENVKIVATTKKKQCVVKVNNDSRGTTTVNGDKVTSTYIPYNTAITVNTTPGGAYVVDGYEVKYKGYTAKLTTIPNTAAELAAMLAELTGEV